MTEIKDKKDFEPVIGELNEILKEKYTDFSGITFFGSRLRGDFSDDSDFDIVALFSKKPTWQKENDILETIYEVELKYDIIIDVKVYHDEEIKKQNTPFREMVMLEGVFYAAYQ